MIHQHVEKYESVEYEIHTLGSGLMLGVWARITLWANLMQHIRTVMGAFSQMLSILVFMAVMFFHVLVSYALDILVAHRISTLTLASNALAVWKRM
jgi:hypothetical protein